MVILSITIQTRARLQQWKGKAMVLSLFSYMFPREQLEYRTYSTDNRPLAVDQASKFHPRLQSVFQQLDAIAPRFVMNKGDIEILEDPKDFYSNLKTKISQAKSRIFLSSLYIGKNQDELLACIESALEAKEDLKVSILTDALRGTREAPDKCSASRLVELVKKFGKHRVDLRMYHTPHLSGLAKKFTPKRLNEGYGLQHMKLYGFDDEIILSGANLSQDYFTNRQDRYYVFKNKSITDYYFKLQNAVSLLSYQVIPSNLKQGFRLDWPTSNKTCEPHMNLQRFISDSSFLLEPLLKQQELTSFDQFHDHENFDTIVYPISQLTPLLNPHNDTSTEKPAVLRLLSYLDFPKIKWWFTAGYFNMLPQIQDRLLNAKATGSVITAAPQANSFYKSPGISYYLPQAYLLFARNFLQQVHKMNKDKLITVFEWKNGIVNTKNGWSYHAKGLWMTVPEEQEPSITIIGSSNYTKRAYTHDLETNAIVITKDPQLKFAMKHEIDNIMKHVNKMELSEFEPKLIESKDEKSDNQQNMKPKYEIDENRKISLGVKLAVKFLGGKL